jgi:hypothetical protein
VRQQRSVFPNLPDPGTLRLRTIQSFTRLPNNRFSHSAAFLYYQLLEDVSLFVDYAEGMLCKSSDEKCTSRVRNLSWASSIDVSYDTISHALKLTASWSHRSHPISISSASNHRTEVGILGSDSPPNLEPHHIGFSGVLTVLGEHKKPSATLFSFPSRHRQTGASFSSGFLEPTGLHPTLQLNVSSGRPPVQDSYCAIHAYLTLPKTIFADKYQLADELFLASKNLTALRYTSFPVDLEAPAYRTTSWGSSILLELSPPQDVKKDKPWTAEVPLHLRYMEPSASGFQGAEMPYPVVFWACAAEEGTKFPNNPFERVNLGYDSLFGPRTIFWHVEPHPETGSRLINTVQVPVIVTDHSSWVSMGTAAAVSIGFAWVVWTLVASYLRTGYTTRFPVAKPTAKSEKNEAKKKQ